MGMGEIQEGWGSESPFSISGADTKNERENMFPFVTKRGSPAGTQSTFGWKSKVQDETPTFFPNKF